MRVVLDVNVLVSAIGWEGPPGLILRACREGRHYLVLSQALLDELARVLAYPKLARLAGHPALPAILAWLHRPEHLVVPKPSLRVVTADPADDRVLEAALAGRAEAIVSGDKHLLELGRFEGIPIVSAAEFADRFLSQTPEACTKTP